MYTATTRALIFEIKCNFIEQFCCNVIYICDSTDRSAALRMPTIRSQHNPKLNTFSKFWSYIICLLHTYIEQHLLSMQINIIFESIHDILNRNIYDKKNEVDVIIYKHMEDFRNEKNHMMDQQPQQGLQHVFAQKCSVMIKMLYRNMCQYVRVLASTQNITSFKNKDWSFSANVSLAENYARCQLRACLACRIYPRRKYVWIE